MKTPTPETDHATAWQQMPRWLKRLNGWASYQLYALFALFDPEAADRFMYEVLREQFERKP